MELEGPESILCPRCNGIGAVDRPRLVFEANITHNLNRMASEAGIYEVIWHPEEVGVKKASHLIRPLREGLAILQSDPERFKRLNPSNGWGDYEGLVLLVSDYLVACENNPNADVSVYR